MQWEQKHNAEGRKGTVVWKKVTKFELYVMQNYVFAELREKMEV